MKNKQHGGALAAVLITLGILGTLAALAVIVFMSANNTANAFDQQVKYEWGNNKQILASYGNKVLDAAQVPGMARDDIARVTEGALRGRYGEDGSRAIFQAITEQNPVIPPGLYENLQQIIIAGRNEFQTSQQRLGDIKRSYETALGSFPQGFIMKALGYPKVPLDTYNIVTSDRAEKSFETGREGPLELRKP